MFLEISQNSLENTYAGASFFNKVEGCGLHLYFTKKEALAQVFSYEFYKISWSTFPYKTPPVAASK